MARVLYILALHRVGLFFLALVVINASLPSRGFKIHSVSRLMSVFSQKVSRVPEVQTLSRVRRMSTSRMMRVTQNPFLWICKWTNNLLGLSPFWCLVLFSNIFLFLFLSELVSLLSRMVTTSVAAGVGIYAVLWPTSYELSLGSSFVFACYCGTAAIKFGLSNQWLQAGIALGALALVDPIAYGLVPLLGYMFYFYQRQFPAAELVKRLALFAIPAIAAFVWSDQSVAGLQRVMGKSALFNLFTTISEGQGVGWTFTHSILGQTITWMFFTLGAIAAAMNHSVLMHRLLPLTFLGSWLLFSPYGWLASRAPFAALCLEGVAGGAPPLTKFIQLVLVLLGAAEIYSVFS